MAIARKMMREDNEREKLSEKVNELTQLFISIVRVCITGTTDIPSGGDLLLEVCCCCCDGTPESNPGCIVFFCILVISLIYGATINAPITVGIIIVLLIIVIVFINVQSTQYLIEFKNIYKDKTPEMIAATTDPVDTWMRDPRRVYVLTKLLPKTSLHRDKFILSPYLNQEIAKSIIKEIVNKGVVDREDILKNALIYWKERN